MRNFSLFTILLLVYLFFALLSINFAGEPVCSKSPCGKLSLPRDAPSVLDQKFDGGVRADLWYDSITICVVTSAKTRSRFNLLKRLLNSLQAADYSLLGSGKLHLRISVDMSTMPQAIDFIENFDWIYGEKIIVRRVLSAGLIRAVSESWYPGSSRDIGLLLEDDIEVSTLYFHWVYNALNAITPEKDRRVVGISLYTPRRVEVAKGTKYRLSPSKLIGVMTRDPTMPYLHQLPCSWGALYFPDFWRSFIEYSLQRLDMGEDGKNSLSVRPINARTHEWKSSWKKFMIEMMYAKGLFMLYPSYPNEVSFSTNNLGVGEHIVSNDTDHLPDDYTVPLMTHKECQMFRRYRDNPLDVPNLSSLPLFDLTNVPFSDLNYISALRHDPSDRFVAPFVYSYWSPEHELQKAVTVNNDLSSGARELFGDKYALKRSSLCKDFRPGTNRLLSNERDGVTVFLSCFDRFDVLEIQLDHYTKSSVVSGIFVTWHDVRRAPPPPMLINGVTVEYVPQRVDSLNNRFHPNMKVVTEAVLIVDDDIKVHLEDLELLFEVWKAHKNYIVGFFPRRMENGKYRLGSIHTWSEPYELMLTKAMMIRKEYLWKYSCESNMEKVHSIVDKFMNCEDIAMNFVVSNATHLAAPLFVEPLHYIGDYGDARFTKRALVKGSIHQKQASSAGTTLKHVDARSECYAAFSSVFNMSGLPKQAYSVKAAMKVRTATSQSSAEAHVLMSLVNMKAEVKQETGPNGQKGHVADFTSLCGYNETIRSWYWHPLDSSFYFDKESLPHYACNVGTERLQLRRRLGFSWVQR